jgi:hypothetical protein
MTERLLRGVAVLGLVLLTGGLGTVRVWADDGPDLVIDVNLNPNDAADVIVTVTNKGNSWAFNSTATVWTDPKSPGDPVTLQVEDLEKGKHTSSVRLASSGSPPLHYKLQAPCGGGRQVTVTAHIEAGDPNQDGGETNTTNNDVTKQVCPGGGANPGQAGGRRGVESKIDQPGGYAGALTKTVTLPALYERAVGRAHSTSGVWPFPVCGFARGGDISVGYWESGCGAWSFYQYMVNFDLYDLDQIKNKTLDRATLRFDEIDDTVTNFEGKKATSFGCVQVLGVATEEWEESRPDHLIAFRTIEISTSGGQTEWDVTAAVDPWLKMVPPRHGFVMEGGKGLPGTVDRHPGGPIDGDRWKGACLAKLQNATLEITYTLGPR